MKNGYYLVRTKRLDSLIGYDIAAYDEEFNSWTFCGDSSSWPHDPDVFEVIKYICDPECTEIKIMDKAEERARAVCAKCHHLGPDTPIGSACLSCVTAALDAALGR